MNPTSRIHANVELIVGKDKGESLYLAMKPETETPSSDRSRTTISLKGDSLTLHIEATDTSALRAALNSYLRWVDGILRLLEEAGSTESI